MLRLFLLMLVIATTGVDGNPYCGDGVVQGWEECDSTDDCNDECELIEE